MRTSVFSVFSVQPHRSPIDLSAPRVEKSSFAADDLSTLRAAGRGTKMSGPKLEHVPEMHRPDGGFQHPLQLPRAVTSAAQKSSAAPDPTTAGNRRTTFEPHRSALPAIFLAWGSVLAAVGAGVPFFILLSARLPNLQRHHRLAQHQHGGSNRCLLTFGNQGSQETLLGDCVARVTG